MIEEDPLERTAFLGAGSAASAPRPASARLIVVDGASRGRVVDLVKQPAVAFGRRDDNDLVLESTVVSKHHGRVVRDGDKWLVEDLGSTNGVNVNGRRLATGERAALFHGDKVGVSDHQILFVREHVAAAAGAPAIALDRTKIAAEADALLAEFGAIRR